MFSRFLTALLVPFFLVACDSGGGVAVLPVDTGSDLQIGAFTDIAPVNTLPFEIEAENTFAEGAGVRSSHSDFSGTGYADYFGNSSAFLAWGFTTGFAEPVIINFRHALGSNASRTLAIEVNGVVVDQFTFETTGSWSTWVNSELTINADAGENILRLIAIGESGPNIDTIAMRRGNPGSTNSNNPGGESSFTLEAEDTILDDVLSRSTHAGFSGTGYADYVGNTDASMAWTIFSEITQTVAVSFRYALDSNSSRTMAIEVNGEIVDQVVFESTDSWSAWESIGVNIDTIAGDNSVRLVATGESGPNIDTITVDFEGTVPSPTPQPIANPTPQPIDNQAPQPIDNPAPQPIDNPAPQPIDNPAPQPLSYDLSTREQVILDSPIVFFRHETGISPDWRERSIEITNLTDEPLTITSLIVDGPFRLIDAGLANGSEIDAGETLLVDVRFEAEGLFTDRSNYIYDGTLQVISEDSVSSTYTVKLSASSLGFPGLRAELPPEGLYDLFDIVADPSGFVPTVPTMGGVGDNVPVAIGEASVFVAGQEQRALFFEAADPNQPVRIQQLAAMHNPGASRMQVHQYSYNEALGAVHESAAFTRGNLLGAYIHDPSWFRTLFPQLQNMDGVYFTDINTNGQVFSFSVNGGTPLGTKSNGNIALQAFAVYDEFTLERVENTYIIYFDFTGGTGGDWNDNTYIVTNIQPFENNLRFAEISDGDSSLANGDTDINPDASFTLAININQQDVSFDASTINSDNVRLVNQNTGQAVPGTVNTTAFQNAITFTPSQLLDANTGYTLLVDGVVASNGTAYESIDIDFTTGESTNGTPLAGIGFALTASIDPDGNGTLVTGLAFNDDQSRLYATTLAGRLLRWEVDQFANLSNPQSLQVTTNFHALTGLTFDKDDPDRLWYVDNTPVGSSETGLAENFSSKLSYIDIDAGNEFSGAVSDFATGFPRGTRDHMVNSIEFGPDGFLYATVGSTSTTGTLEFPLSASVLRIDTDALPPVGGFNLNTDQGYDPQSFGAPVTVYAEGLRNAYDLVWHSNGFLYSANNGSIGGGGTPDDPSTPANEAIPSGVATQRDYLYKVEAGGYYGHPNTTQGNYVLAGGNPTANVDPAEEILYPVGTQPDPGYRGFVHDFGLNRSPNGSIEYTATAFNGALAGTLMVGEWSGGDRIVGLTLNGSGQVLSSFVVVDGLTNPIDITVHEETGSLIIAEMGDAGVVSVHSPTP